MRRICNFKIDIACSTAKRIKLPTKRLLDILGAIVGIVLASPLLTITAVLIKLTSKGPVLFKQTRVGLKGRLFTMLKFRSMRVDASEQDHKTYISKLMGNSPEFSDAQLKLSGYKEQIDRRITAIDALFVGRVLMNCPSFLTCSSAI